MKRKIHIESLHLRLKNVSPEQAGAVGKNLGHEILRHIADGEAKQNTDTRRVERLDAVLKNESRGGNLQKQIASRIAALIGERNR
jgi:hypothetical protein